MSSSISKPPPSATCWICLDVLDENNAELQRGCACRGDDSGWAHVSCLSSYAQKRSEKAYAANIGTASSKPAQFIEAMKHAWLKCPTCMQTFTGGMLSDMSIAFSDSCENLAPTDPRYLIAMANFGSLLAENGFSPLYKNIPIDDVLKNALSIARSGAIEPSSIANTLEPEIILNLVQVYMQRGDHCLALKYSKEMRDYGIKNGAGKEELGAMEECISKISGQSSNYEVSTSYSLKLLNESIKENGKDNITTFEKVKHYAMQLFSSGKHSEACELLEEYIPRSRRVLGPNHPETKWLEGMLAEFPKSVSKTKLYSATLVGYQDPSLKGRKIHFGPTKGDEGKYVVFLGDQAGMKKPKKFKVPAENLVFARGTPVILLDLVSARHLNGMLGKIESYVETNGRYKVILQDDEKREIMVKKENVRVDFEDRAPTPKQPSVHATQPSPPHGLTEEQLDNIRMDAFFAENSGRKHAIEECAWQLGEHPLVIGGGTVQMGRDGQSKFVKGDVAKIYMEGKGVVWDGSPRFGMGPYVQKKESFDWIAAARQGKSQERKHIEKFALSRME